MKKLTSSSLRLAVLTSCASIALPALSSAQLLLSHYQLNGSTSDSGSVGADGSLQGTASFISNAPGNLAQSLDVTGSGSNYMEANVADAYSGLSQLTITLWVNTQGGPLQNERLLSNMEASTLDGFDLRMSTNGTSPFKLSYDVNSTSSPAVSNFIDAADSWTFIALTYDVSSVGSEVNYYTGTESIAASLLNTGTENSGALNASSLLHIGGTPASGSDRTPPAYLSDVRVYSGVLSLSQLETVRASVNAVPEPSSFALIAGGLMMFWVVRRRR